MIDYENYPDSSQDVKQNPDIRQTEPGITLNTQKIKVLLTTEEVLRINSESGFPSIRESVREINGQPVEVIEELYRIDPIGRVIRNDDFAGISWLMKKIIPSDLIAICPGYFGVHQDPRQLCLFVDGFPITFEPDFEDSELAGKTLSFCSTCHKIFSEHVKWYKRSSWLFPLHI